MSVYVLRVLFRLRDQAKRLSEQEDDAEALAVSHDNFSRITRNRFKQFFGALRELITLPDPPERQIGFISFNAKANKTSCQPKCNARLRGPARALLVFPENSVRERNLLGRQKLLCQVQESNSVCGRLELKDHFDLEFSWLLIWK